MSNITILPEGRPYRRVTCDCSNPALCRNELCYMHSCNYLCGIDKPNYPVPALNLEVIPLVIDGECIAIDIVNRSGDGPWPIAASFDKY